jgi:S1-C subfamily serine protease
MIRLMRSSMIAVAFVLCGFASADPPRPRRTAATMAVENANPSIVTIVASVGGKQMSVAAVVVDSNGLLLAPSATMRAGDTVDVIANDNSRLAAKLLLVDDKIGVSVLRIVGAKRLKPLEFAEVRKFEVGESVLLLGRSGPDANGRLVHHAIVSAKDRMLVDEHVIQIDTSVGPGSPPGVVIDLDGKFVGLATKAGGIQFVAPHDRLKRLLVNLPK